MDMDMICYCGHDCARCVVYLATVRDDDALRGQAQRFYEQAFGRVLPLSEIHCKGGRSGAVLSLCAECPWARCCRERGIEACAHCTAYPCAPLADYPKTIRQQMQSDLISGNTGRRLPHAEHARQHIKIDACRLVRAGGRHLLRLEAAKPFKAYL